MARLRKTINEHLLETKNLQQVLDNLPEPIFVTDCRGNVLLANSATALTLDMTLDRLLKTNVNELVSKGYYTNSNVMEAVKNKRAVSGVLKTNLNLIYASTSTPVFDEAGKVTLVITTAHPGDSGESCQSREESELVDRRKREIEYLRNRVMDDADIVAESRLMRQVLLAAHTLSQTNSTVLLIGESGTGKEVLAKYIYRHSKQAAEAFIAVNCATFPENLVEAELFGYEKGAFTGAKAEGKTGLFEAAHRGTLFLDEISELPLHLQSKLLRVLETSEVRRIGSNFDRKISFRLIAATNKDLQKMTEEGSFRNDLYYRLNVIPIRIPPLRERPEDIMALAKKFLADFNKRYETAAELDLDTLEVFQRYSWPGNVRELRNLVERRVISGLQDYPDESVKMAAGVQRDLFQDYFKQLGAKYTLKDVMGKIEERYIRYMLQACGGRVGEASKRLGVYRTVLYRKLKAYDKTKNSY
ncbi:MAG: sigma 54-interacting transcriptional regulator [Sporomusaceae bacterium]|nr:sigma 54-interacting transcriptional regulator [Sporomusaceae bacterium]